MTQKHPSPQPELVAPAGDGESLAAALGAGADSVYCGVKEHNLRINARNFELNELPRVAQRCHDKNVRLYLTLNGLVFDSEHDAICRTITIAKDAGVDALIAWDMAVVQEALRQHVPVHLSTQASVANSDALRFYYERGVRRVVLARECSLDMIRAIIATVAAEKMDMTIEVFVHGAMCVSISGRCFISEYLYGRSANRGDCLQPCRRKFHITELDEGGELEAEDGYVLSPKDICTIEIIDQLIAAGIGAFKIEGRVRPPEYIAAVTRVYRSAIDDYYAGSLTREKKQTYRDALEKVYNRGFSTGFYLGRPLADLAGASGSVSSVKKEYVGDVTHYYQKIGVAEIVLRNGDLARGTRLLITGKTTGAYEQTVAELEVNHAAVERAARGTAVAVKMNTVVRRGDKVFVLKGE